MVDILSLVERLNMSGPIQANKIVAHGLALVVGVGLAVWSGQNPRVLLFAQAISLLYRFISTWVLALNCESQGSAMTWAARLSRKPKSGEKSRPYRDERRHVPAGIGTYLVVILTIIFMLMVILEMTGGTGFQNPSAMVSELSWAALIAGIYWADDLFSQQIVLAPGEPRAINLGYNVSGLNFLLAAIFISGFLILIVQVFVGMFLNDWPADLSIILTWMVFLILSLIRFAADTFELANGNLRQR